MDILSHHFPQIRPEAAHQQAGIIAQGLGVIAKQQHDQYQETKREKESAKQTTLSKFLDDKLFAQLLRMLRLPNEAAVIAACPVYQKIAQATKGKQRGELQGAIRQELVRRGNPYLKVPISPGVWTNFISLEWERLG